MSDANEVDDRAYARLVAGVARHRDNTLRDWLTTNGHLRREAVREAVAEHSRRRAACQPVLLESLLLERALVDDHDLMAAFAGDTRADDTPRYELGERLGEGAGGIVYRAKDRLLGRFVALKVRKAGALGDAVAMFDEGASLAKLRHANVVTVFDAGLLDGQPFVATECIDGATFADLLQQRSTPLHQLVQTVADVACGLGAAHRLGIVHRDVKPSNVLLDGAGVARVCDFGLAQAVGDARGRRAGTLRYMAPEQFEGSTTAITPATDVYGAGAMLYQVLVGVPPFATVDVPALPEAVQGRDPTPPHALARVPRELSAIAMRALARRPGDRYRDGDDLAADLAAWLRGDPVRARPMALLPRTWRAARRHPARAVGAIAVAVAALAIATLCWLQRERSALREQLGTRMQQAAEFGLQAVARLRRAGDTAGMAALAAPVETACNDVLAAFPADGRPHYVLACLYRTSLQYDRAWHQIRLAAQLLPNDPDVRFERGMLGMHSALLSQQRQREFAQRGELWRGVGGWARTRFQALHAALDDLDRAAVVAAAEDLGASRRPSAVRLARALASPDTMATLDLLPPEEIACDTDVYAWLAAAAMRRGDFSRARTFATCGHQHDRGSGMLLLLRASATLQEFDAGERRAEALTSVFTAVDEDLAAALALQAEDADLLERASLVWLWLHDEATQRSVPLPGDALGRAIAALTTAVRVEPTKAERWHGLGIAHLERLERQRSAGAERANDFSAAMAALNRAVELDPGRAAFHESRGHLFLDAQRSAWGAARGGADHLAAMQSFELAAQLAPRHIGPYLGMASSLQIAGRREAAIAVLEGAQQRLPAGAAMLSTVLSRLRR